MHYTYVKVILLAAGAAQLTNAHTAFTNFFVDGVDQGDGTAVRMSNDIPNATFPISSATSPDMACGKFWSPLKPRPCWFEDSLFF